LNNVLRRENLLLEGQSVLDLVNSARAAGLLRPEGQPDNPEDYGALAAPVFTDQTEIINDKVLAGLLVLLGTQAIESIPVPVGSPDEPIVYAMILEVFKDVNDNRLADASDSVGLLLISPAGDRQGDELEGMPMNVPVAAPIVELGSIHFYWDGIWWWKK
jgi:hypothetical protein